MTSDSPARGPVNQKSPDESADAADIVLFFAKDAIAGSASRAAGDDLGLRPAARSRRAGQIERAPGLVSESLPPSREARSGPRGLRGPRPHCTASVPSRRHPPSAISRFLAASAGNLVPPQGDRAAVLTTARQGVSSLHMSVRVLVKNGEPLEKTLRRLRKICNNEGLTRDLKRSAVYEKPSERRRRKARERQKAIRQALKKGKEKGERPRREPKE